MTKLAVILGIPIAILATVASLGIVVVDVREGGPDGHRIVVPVPLVLAQAALTLAPVVAPADKLRIPNHEVLEHVGLAREVLEALAAAPDCELVRVEERDEQVVITKEGQSLRVHVSGKKENVSVNVPLHLAMQALPDKDGRIHTAALAGALGAVRFTDLVDVQDGKDHVRVYVWLTHLRPGGMLRIPPGTVCGCFVGFSPVTQGRPVQGRPSRKPLVEPG